MPEQRAAGFSFEEMYGWATGGDPRAAQLSQDTLNQVAASLEQVEQHLTGSLAGLRSGWRGQAGSAADGGIRQHAEWARGTAQQLRLMATDAGSYAGSARGVIERMHQLMEQVTRAGAGGGPGGVPDAGAAEQARQEATQQARDLFTRHAAVCDSAIPKLAGAAVPRAGTGAGVAAPGEVSERAGRPVGGLSGETAVAAPAEGTGVASAGSGVGVPDGSARGGAGPGGQSGPAGAGGLDGVGGMAGVGGRLGGGTGGRDRSGDGGGRTAGGPDSRYGRGADGRAGGFGRPGHAGDVSGGFTDGVAPVGGVLGAQPYRRTQPRRDTPPRRGTQPHRDIQHRDTQPLRGDRPGPPARETRVPDGAGHRGADTDPGSRHDTDPGSRHDGGPGSGGATMLPPMLGGTGAAGPSQQDQWHRDTPDYLLDEDNLFMGPDAVAPPVIGR